MSVKQYLDLITSEHRDKPKFTSWLTVGLQKAQECSDTVDLLSVEFDIDSAVGKQLDILGAIIGRTRVLAFQPSGGVSPMLDDETYRLVLKAKIAQNQWDGTTPGIYTIWSTVFPTFYLELIDNQDMTMDAIVVGFPTQLQQELVQNGYIVPKPEGVRVNYQIITTPIFAYDLDTPALAGYDIGKWYQNAPLFSYDEEDLNSKEYQGYGKGAWV